MVITYSYFDYIVVHNSRWCDFWPMVHRLCDIWFFDTMKSYDVGFIGLLHVVFGIAWCCNLQILRGCMICVQCLCWFKSIFRYWWILFFLKNRWVSGHMRWGIAFRPRWKSPPFGMFQYFQMHILVSKILNLDHRSFNPPANIFACCSMAIHAGIPWPSPPPLMSGFGFDETQQVSQVQAPWFYTDFSVPVTCLLFKRGS